MINAVLDNPEMESRRRRSAGLAVGMNLLPAAGVFFLGWNVGWFLFLYWMENIIVGLFTAVKIAMCRGSLKVPDNAEIPAEARDKLPPGFDMDQFSRGANIFMRIFLVPFFILHYGGFCVGHGVFVFALFGESLAGGPVGTVESVRVVLEHVLRPGTFILLLPLVAIQADQFFNRFIAMREYETKAPNNMMVEPYGRIVVLHLTILAAGFIFLSMGANRYTALLLILFKTAMDIFFNNRAWKAIAKSGEVKTAAPA